jgi:hypothetical protein
MEKIEQTNLRARWVETEALRLKLVGLSSAAAAELIMRAGRLYALRRETWTKEDISFLRQVTPPARGTKFPKDFRISKQGVHKAAMRALLRVPKLKTEDYVRLECERMESIVLRLQQKINAGDARAAEAAILAMKHRAKLLGIYDRRQRRGDRTKGTPTPTEPTAKRTPVPSKAEQLARAIEIARILQEVTAAHSLESVAPPPENGTESPSIGAESKTRSS